MQGYEWFRLRASFRVLREVQRRVLWFRVGGGGGGCIKFRRHRHQERSTNTGRRHHRIINWTVSRRATDNSGNTQPEASKGTTVK